MAKIERKSRIEFVALGKIFVSELSQREIREYRVDALVSEFDIDRIGQPILNKRGDRYPIRAEDDRLSSNHT